MSDSIRPAKETRLEPGTRLDRYELLCVLAHGGMANVWLARVQGKLGFNKLFAIKTILPNVADDAAFKEMFLDEARIASRIQHSNVVHMPDVGEFAGTTYLVMDLVDGEPLSKLPRACEKRGEKLPLGIVLRILADACHGLHAAHELRGDDGNPLNVVHRDMSPHNILVSKDGLSKVIDFGVAKARDRSTAATNAGTLKGKINYMPREQALGLEVDRRADVWALGAVLYYLLTGRTPYKEESQLATLKLVMNGAPIPALPPSFPAPLRTAVMRALAHDPAERFQTAQQMGNALEELMRKLQIVTTHAQVAAFVQRILGERLAARQQLVADALVEAANRERAREALAAAVESVSGEDLSSFKEGVVAVPASSSQPSVAASPVSSSSLETGTGPGTGPGPGTATREGSSPTITALDVGTSGSFAATIAGQRRPTWPLVVGGAVGALGVVGLLLVGLSLRGRPSRAAAQPAAAPPVSAVLAPSSAASAVPPVATEAPSTAPSASASAQTESKLAPSATASASAKPAKAPWLVGSGRPSGAAARPTQGGPKRQDDEAGF